MRRTLPRLLLCLMLLSVVHLCLPAREGIYLPDSLAVPDRPDTTYLHRLLQFGNQKLTEDPRLALQAYRRMGEVAEDIRSPRFQGKTHDRVAMVYLIANQSDSALVFLDSAMQYATALADSHQIYSLELHLGISYFQKGHQERALQAYRRALAYFQQQGNDLYVARLANNIGNIYVKQEDHAHALEQFHESLRAGVEAENSILVTASLNNLGSTFLTLEQLDSAEVYLERSYAHNREQQSQFAHWGLCSLLAKLRMKQGRLDEAAPYLEEGMETARMLNAPTGVANLLHKQGEWLEAQGKYRQALQAFDSAAHYALISQSTEGEMNIAESRYLLLKKMGQDVGALSAYERMHELQDSITGLERTQRLEELTELHRTERKQQEIHGLKSERELQERLLNQQKWLIGGLGIAFLSTLALLAFVIVNARRRRQDNQVLQQQNDHIDRQQQEIMAQNTALAQQNQHLETLNAEMEGLIEIVAHDLKSPISKTQAVVELIGEVKDPGEIPLYVSMVRQILGGGMNLIQDILAIRRIEGQSEPLEFQSLDLIVLLSDMQTSFTPAARDKGIQLDFEGPVGKLEVSTVPGDLERILENLISNAIKFSPPHTQVLLSLLPGDENVEISIRDQGPGISPADQSRMFQKFQRLSAQPTAGESSTGLGLAIVKTLAERLGGTIVVESELGQGALFTLRLPCS